MNNPIITINNATREQAVEIFKEVAYSSSNIGYSCKIRLNASEIDNQYIITFPSGVNRMGDLADVIAHVWMEVNAENIDHHDLSMRAFLDGSFLDGPVKPQGVVNIVYANDDPVVVDSEGKCYIEDDDAEDVLYEKTPDIDYFYFCIKPTANISEGYIAYPQHVDNHGLEGVEDLEIKAELTSKEKMAKRASDTAGCLKPILGAVVYLGLSYVAFMLFLELDPFFLLVAIWFGFYLTVDSVFALRKPVPSVSKSAFSRFYDSLEHHSIKAMIIVNLIFIGIFGYNKYGCNEIERLDCKILPQTPSQVQDGEIEVELTDGSTTEFKNEKNVRILRGKKHCVLEYRKGALGFDAFQRIYSADNAIKK